ncbi:hypothetical protein [uncultured Microbacterium sp.]|uniref:hypothetical protein n=1 Tax=uncultured Microbacterium sp. TaxID=191216 RepID=UPI0025F7C720|nr:hypothetical protein [uncultured Microbacterium sp.]
MINPVASEVGNLVLSAIKEAGRTKLSVSDATGIPYPTFNRKAAGKSEFSFTELLEISEELGATPAAFVPEAFRQAPEALPLAEAS